MPVTISSPSLVNLYPSSVVISLKEDCCSCVVSVSSNVISFNIAITSSFLNFEMFFTPFSFANSFNSANDILSKSIYLAPLFNFITLEIIR